MMLDFFGHVAYLLIGLGMWLLGRGDVRGFLAQAGGAFLWVMIGFLMPSESPYLPIILWNILFGLIGTSGYYRLRGKL